MPLQKKSVKYRKEIAMLKKSFSSENAKEICAFLRLLNTK